MVFEAVKRSLRGIDNARRDFRTISEAKVDLCHKGQTRIGVHLHAFYEESSKLAVERLSFLPPINELIITGEDVQLNEDLHQQALKINSIKNVKLIQTAHGVKDTEIFIQMVSNSAFDNSHVILKIHGKSMKDHARAQWARRCIEEIVPNSEECESIIRQLNSCVEPAVAIPKTAVAGFETNAKFLTKLKRTNGRNLLSVGNSIYPAGSMFWANGSYFEHMRLTIADWNPEYLSGQTRKAEIIERLLFDGIVLNQSLFTYPSRIQNSRQTKLKDLVTQ
jgi:hypothetical protein